MFGRNLKFYPGLTKKYTAMFGNLFNDIWIDRSDGTNLELQTMKVPLAYGPREKYLAKLREDADGARDVSLTLPRMSYELVSLVYDPVRAINPMGVARERTATNGTYANVYNPVPYNLYFQLSIMTKTIEDGMKIIEQIMPYFKPDLTVAVQLFEEMPTEIRNIPIVLNNVSNDDSYEGSFENRRALVWVLDFTVKAYFYSDIRQSKKIKIAFTNIYPSFNQTPPNAKVTVYAGLTANGEPTQSPNNAIDPLLVNEEDDWDFVIIKEDIIDDA